MDAKFFDLKLLEKINHYFNIEKFLETLYKNKNVIYELSFLVIFFIAVYSIINIGIINPIFKLLSKNKKANVDRLKTIIRTIKNIIKLTLLFIFILFMLNRLGINIKVFLTSAGILGTTLIIIFQNSIKDFLSGWFFVIEDTFREGEYIIVNNTFKGRVDNLKSRYLVLRGDEGELIMIPYGQVNFVHNFSRKRTINKIILRLKKESYDEKILNILKSFLEDLAKKFTETMEMEILDNIEISESYVEFIIKFKTPFSQRNMVKTKIKNELFSNFKEIILEIKDAS